MYNNLNVYGKSLAVSITFMQCHIGHVERSWSDQNPQASEASEAKMIPTPMAVGAPKENVHRFVHLVVIERRTRQSHRGLEPHTSSGIQVSRVFMLASSIH